MTPFEFRRTKGIVWVCDLVSSSSYLNNNESADEIEQFIPRLYYVSKLLVESYGGIFLKWTGDGFLAFFEMELDRNKEATAKKIFESAWQLTFMCNVTQLGLNPKKNFLVRHGVTYEKDALLMKIASDSGQETLDIIGRAVVLAFRLSGIQAEFPSIVTVQELVESTNRKFIKWKPNEDEKKKFFKGEKFGTAAILKFSDQKKEKVSLKTVIKKSKEAISSAESTKDFEANNAIYSFTQKMSSGPEWCRQIIKSHTDFIRTDLLGTLKSVVTILEKQATNGF